VRVSPTPAKISQLLVHDPLVSLAGLMPLSILKTSEFLKESDIMKGDQKVIGFLNAVLRNELVAINQYFLHSRMYKDMGLTELADHEHGESLDEMKHADQLIERTLFLEGLPNMQDIGKLRIGENPREMLECDLALELDALPELRDAIAWCEECRDFVSRDLFDSILASEEEHVDWLETQLALIDKMGIENYLQAKMG
jgi:bacterioferritin